MADDTQQACIQEFFDYRYSDYTTFGIAVSVEGILFGILLPVYAIGVYTILYLDQPHGQHKRNRVFLAADTALLLLTLVHMVLSLRRLLMKPCNAHLSSHWGGFSALIDAIVTTVPSEGEIDISARLAIYVTQTLIGDGLMIYRLWIVWNKSRRVLIIPALFMFLDAACGYVAAFFLFLWPIAMGCFWLSLCANMLTSGLIIWRVIRTKPPHAYCNSDGYPSQHNARNRRVFEAIIQSAAIYSVASLFLGIGLLASDGAIAVLLTIMPPVIGLVFSGIVIRTGRSSMLKRNTHQEFHQGVHLGSRPSPLSFTDGLSHRSDNNNARVVHSSSTLMVAGEGSCVDGTKDQQIV